ncbi:DHS-like NAD/FAD-binding domain-containing protein, partial [Cryphonectria parasitica EP155]
MDTFSHLSSPPTDQAGHISSLKRPVASAFNNESQVLTNGQRPAKKRRKAEQKPRSTERLDLTNEDAADETQLNRLLDVLRTKRKIVVIAGAGISVSAGIPDFRSSKGLFEEYKSKTLGSGAALFDVSVYNSNNSTKQFHAMVCDLSVRAKEAEPTAFHNMLATIAHEGRLQRLYSQNIDCLETSLLPLATKTPLPAKKPWPTTIQVHGGLEKMHCMKCKFVSNFDASLFQGSEAPLCNLCKEQDDIRTGVYGKRSHGIGRLRPRIHLYNESSPDEDAIGAVSQADLRQVPDAVLVVGTSLVVPGIRRIAQQLCRATRSTRDGFTAWINPDPEPRGCDLKDVWDMVVCGRSDTIASLLGLPHWD